MQAKENACKSKVRSECYENPWKIASKKGASKPSKTKRDDYNNQLCPEIYANILRQYRCYQARFNYQRTCFNYTINSPTEFKAYKGHMQQLRPLA